MDLDLVVASELEFFVKTESNNDLKSRDFSSFDIMSALWISLLLPSVLFSSCACIIV